MILSSVEMRWAEIKFYTFCNEIYKVNNDMIDLVYAIETICRLGKLDPKPIKSLAGKLLADPYYSPSRAEIIQLGRLIGYSFVDLGKMLNNSRQGVRQILERQKDKYYPSPKLQTYEDQRLIKFNEQLDKLQKVGLVV